MRKDTSGGDGRGAARVVLLRHGESQWNARQLFTGWANPALTLNGEQQAIQAGRMLAEHHLLPGYVHTSLLRRTIRSAELALERCDRDWIPVRRSWRLNGRHYGALQGCERPRVRADYGDEQFTRWRRSYAVPPPPMEAAARRTRNSDPRYAAMSPDALPLAESLADVTARLLPYWHDAIVPDARSGECVLIVSHANTLRALVGYLDGLGEDAIAGLEIPNGEPLLYELDGNLRPLTPGGRRLAGPGRPVAARAWAPATGPIPGARQAGRP